MITFPASMGPQPNGCGKEAGRQTGPSWSRVLQWGRSRMAAESWMARRSPMTPAWLQWGRSRMAAERCYPPKPS